MQLDYFYQLKNQLNHQGLVMTPGLTYQNNKLEKIFSSIQRIDGNYLKKNDFDILIGQNIMTQSPYLEKLMKEFAFVCGISNENIIIFSQEKIKGDLIKLFFETEQSYDEMKFALETIKKYYKWDFDFSQIPDINNPLYGLTIDIAKEEIVNFKIYLETESPHFFSPELLKFKEIYPYLVMYSYKKKSQPSIFEYWSYSKDLPISQRVQFTKDIFGIDIPFIDESYFEFKEFQYSRDDSKMNFYLFDNTDPISRAKNDN